MPKAAQTGKKLTPARGKGRPAKTIRTGMSQKVLDRKFAQLDALLDNSQLKKGTILPLFIASHISHAALDALDPDIINCWHFARVDPATRTLADVGENAVS